MNRRLATFVTSAAVMASVTAIPTATALAFPGTRNMGAMRRSARPSVRHSVASRQLSMDRVLLQLINKGRRAHGIRPVRMSKHQSTCSRAHSRAMASAGYLSHALPQDLCVHFMAAGENVGVWAGSPPATLEAMNATMWAEGPCPSACSAGSQLWEVHGHYLNMVDSDYSRVGIGFVQVKNETWLTEDFMN